MIKTPALSPGLIRDAMMVTAYTMAHLISKVSKVSELSDDYYAEQNFIQMTTTCEALSSE